MINRDVKGHQIGSGILPPTPGICSKTDIRSCSKEIEKIEFDKVIFSRRDNTGKMTIFKNANLKGVLTRLPQIFD